MLSPPAAKVHPGTHTASCQSMEMALAAGLRAQEGAVTSRSRLTDGNGIWHREGRYVRPRIWLTSPACQQEPVCAAAVEVTAGTWPGPPDVGCGDF